MPRGGRTSTSGQGRPKGTPNKATSEARQAIALFVEANAYRLTEWLDAVADGTHNGKPDPAKAFELFHSVVEFHIPKLARQELVGDPDKPLIPPSITFVRDGRPTN